MNTYIVAPPYVADRLSDTHQQKSIKQIWRFASDAPTMHGTLATNALRFDDSENRFKLLDNSWDGFAMQGTSMVMSSALMLYRLLCVFGYPPRMPLPDQQYKVLWEYPLQHESTGEYIIINDQKAGWTVSANFTDPDQLPVSLANDLLVLLDFLVSDKVSHPYDGTLAGSVA